MKPTFKKYINYVKEAFYTPVHMVALGLTSIISIVGMIVMNAVGMEGAPILLVLLGLEMLYLGLMSQNSRFIRAVNAKYHKEIEAYHKTKTVAEFYNSLTAPRQRRFEHFKSQLDNVRENYQKLHGNFPNVVNRFLDKINNLQLKYVKLLFMQDKYPDYMNRENPDEIRSQIGDIQAKMANDSEKVKRLKEKRIELMQRRIVAYKKAKEHGQIIGVQLQTIEEMVQYIKEHSVTLKNPEEEDMLIDNILFETEQMQETISDLESIMTSDFNVGDYGDLGTDYTTDANQVLN